MEKQEYKSVEYLLNNGYLKSCAKITIIQ